MRPCVRVCSVAAATDAHTAQCIWFTARNIVEKWMNNELEFELSTAFRLDLLHFIFVRMATASLLLVRTRWASGKFSHIEILWHDLCIVCGVCISDSRKVFGRPASRHVLKLIRDFVFSWRVCLWAIHYTRHLTMRVCMWFVWGSELWATRARCLCRDRERENKPQPSQTKNYLFGCWYSLRFDV